MNKKYIRIISGAVCLFLALVILCLSAVSCADRVRDPVLESKNSRIPLSMYEFMLARMKGTLARNDYDVGPLSDFWSEKHEGTELTNEEYYNQTILENCKNYLAALVIFEDEGLTLPESVIAEIENDIEFLIDYDCDGSEEKFDALLAKFGTDTDGLRKIYETEAKYREVLKHLYGEEGKQISDGVKEEYYRENYHRFKQMIVSNFYYEYETDKNGDMIYFDPESSMPIYDAENGEYRFDDSGMRLEDEYGVDIRFDAEGNYLYDKENGVPAPVCDEDGKAIKHLYSDEEMEQRAAKVADIVNSVSGGNTSAFEALMPEWEVYIGAGESYPDGYYLSDLESGGYQDNMLEILEKLKTMKVGETAVVENEESGYHIIMKYELDKGKYSKTEYAEWFEAFNSSLITKLFEDKCSSYYGEMSVNSENLKKAKSIRSIGTNYDY